MKSTLANAAPATPAYPFLGRARISQKVVLFTKPSVGTVLNIGNGGDPLGTHSTYWSMGDFDPLAGSITLEN